MAVPEMFYAVSAIAVDDHKTLELMQQLQISQVEAFGLRCSVWAWGRRLQSRGVLPRLNDAQIAVQLRWIGDGATCVHALINAGILDRANGVLTIHGWEEFQQPLIDKYEDASERGRERVRKRWDRSKTTDVHTDVSTGVDRREIDRYIDRENPPLPPVDDLADAHRVLSACPFISPANIGPSQRKLLRELIQHKGEPWAIDALTRASKAKPSNVVAYAIGIMRSDIAANAAAVESKPGKRVYRD